jgi:ankyrin repeat protein
VLSELGEVPAYQRLGFYLMTNVNLDIQDKTNYSALHYASWCGFENTVGDLLSAGANSALREHTNLTAEQLAHLAAEQLAYPTEKQLLKAQEKYLRIQEMINSEPDLEKICAVQEVSYEEIDKMRKTYTEKVEERSESRHR